VLNPLLQVSGSASFLQLKNINVQFSKLNLRNMLSTGPSQAGKSSFHNILSNKQICEVGNGSGKSTTKKCTIYKILASALFPTEKQFIDTCGSLDSDLSLSNDELRKMIVNTVLNDSMLDELDCILAFESLRGDSVNLKKTLESLRQMFGPNVFQTVIVMLTKGDAVDPAELSVRMTEEVKICNSYNVKYITWNNCNKGKSLTADQLSSQIMSLKTAMASVKKLKIQDIVNNQKWISDKAAELHRNNITKQPVTSTILVPEQYTERVTETRYQDVVKTRQVPRTVEKIGYNQVRHVKKHRFLGIVYDSDVWYENVPYKYNETVYDTVPYTVQEPYQVQIDVPRTRTVTKTVTNYIDKEKHPLDYYIPQARKMLAAQNK